MKSLKTKKFKKRQKLKIVYLSGVRGDYVKCTICKIFEMSKCNKSKREKK